ncbi:T3SS_Flik_C domain containing protein [Paracoccaceae bacterium]
MLSAPPDITSVRPTPFAFGKGLEVPDGQTSEAEADFFVDALGSTDPATQTASPALVPNDDLGVDPSILLAVAWFVPDRTALASVILEDIPSQRPPMGATELTTQKSAALLSAGQAPQELGSGASFGQELADAPRLLLSDPTAASLQTPDIAPGILQSLQSGTQRAVDNTLPLADAAVRPSAPLNPEGLGKTGVSPTMPDTKAAPLLADLSESATAKLDPRYTPQPMPAIVASLRVELPGQPFAASPKSNAAPNEVDDGASTPIRQRHPSVHEHSLRLTATPALGIDSPGLLLPGAPAAAFTADTVPAYAPLPAEKPAILTDPTAREPATALPAPIAEVAGKITPMVSDQPAQPSDLAVALQPGAQINTPGAAPAGQIGTTTPAPPQTPMQQASAALVRLAADAPGRIELTLTPETLGRVHFDMRPEGAGLAITVSAERSETLELIRRHLPDLLAELRQAGVQAGTLSFGSWAEGQSAPSKEGWTKTQDDDPAPTPLDRSAPVHQPTLAVTGLNLRL